MSEAAKDAKQGQPQPPLQRLRRRALSVACAFGLAALILFWGQVCPNVKLLRNESRNAFLGALRRKSTVQETSADGAAPPRPAKATTTRTTTVHPPFWL